jgi:hypothetical protein
VLFLLLSSTSLFLYLCRWATLPIENLPGLETIDFLARARLAIASSAAITLLLGSVGSAGGQPFWGGTLVALVATMSILLGLAALVALISGAEAWDRGSILLAFGASVVAVAAYLAGALLLLLKRMNLEALATYPAPGPFFVAVTLVVLGLLTAEILRAVKSRDVDGGSVT